MYLYSSGKAEADFLRIVVTLAVPHHTGKLSYWIKIIIMPGSLGPYGLLSNPIKKQKNSIRSCPP